MLQRRLFILILFGIEILRRVLTLNITEVKSKSGKRSKRDQGIKF